jgi:DNA repair exonuclease SbcCD nuclease subunit
MIGYDDVVNILMKPTELKFADADQKIIMIPWINSENEYYTLKCLDQTDAKICLGHFEFKGFQMYRGAIAHDGMDMKPFKKFDAVYSGHYHTKSMDGNIAYLGAQMEFTWADCDDPKYFHILDLETGDLQAVNNPLTLFTKVVYDDEEFDYNRFDYNIFDNQFVKVIVANKTNLSQFENFISNIQLKKTYDLKIVESFDNSMVADDEKENTKFEETSELISQYIDATDTLLDKSILKSQLKELYNEALYAERL